MQHVENSLPEVAHSRVSNLPELSAPQAINPAPQSAVEIHQALQAHGIDSWIVGGYVRDQLLERTPKDIDLCANASYQDIKQAVEQIGAQSFEVGEAFGILHVVYRDDCYEIASLRKDGPYSDGVRPDWVKTGREVSLEDDAMRRDFSINALYQDIASGEIIDMVGGLTAVKDREIKAVGNPRDRILEDQVRMLRAVRFSSQLGFSIETETAGAIKEHALLIAKVSQERCGAEFLKILASSRPAWGLTQLQELGLFQPLLPKLELNDALLDTVQLLSDTSPQVILAGMLLDCPNPKQALKRVVVSKQLLKQVQSLIEGSTLMAAYPALSVLERDRLLGQEDILEIAMVHRASKISRGLADHYDLVIEDLAAATDLRPSQQPWADDLANGSMLKQAGFKPGKEFKSLLERARTAQLSGEFSDTVGAQSWVETLRS